MRETNPVLVRLWRNEELESLHRGAWALVGVDGEVIESAGDPDQFVFGRSSTKSLQALPLIETGAADAFGFGPENIALALASHSGEPVHVQVAADGLRRIGLDPSALRCGPRRPRDAGVDAGAERILNDCSGKHIGFLAVARHLGVDPATYLDPSGPVQRAVATAVSEMSDVDLDALGHAIDGCSAPTFRLPLASLALGLTRVANPAGLGAEREQACRRITEAARSHPVLVGGNHEQFTTELLRITDGRAFAKTGAEGVMVVGIVGRDVGLAIKIDDGAFRAVYPVVIEVLARHGLLEPAEIDILTPWMDTTRRNWDGLVVGRTEVL